MVLTFRNDLCCLYWNVNSFVLVFWYPTMKWSLAICSGSSLKTMLVGVSKVILLVCPANPFYSNVVKICLLRVGVAFCLGIFMCHVRLSGHFIFCHHQLLRIPWTRNPFFVHWPNTQVVQFSGWMDDRKMSKTRSLIIDSFLKVKTKRQFIILI